MLVGMAQEAGLPTIEIQSGTISPTPRFVKPSAQDVLCIDPFSHSVYVDYFGLAADSVFLVGSPKIDHDLAPFKGLSRDYARNELASVIGPLTTGTVFTLASQPIGVSSISAVVRVAMEAVAKRPNATLLIKQHRREDESYLAAYESIAREVGLDKLIIAKEVSVQLCVLAADVVMTYYSTVGLEAFSLRRPLICINPFDARPPFSLSDICKAPEVKTAAELLAYLDGTRPIPTAPELSVLQDGKAAERCLDHIRNRISERRSHSIIRRLLDAVLPHNKSLSR
jgi:hypothetical protein